MDDALQRLAAARRVLICLARTTRVLQEVQMRDEARAVLDEKANRATVEAVEHMLLQPSPRDIQEIDWENEEINDEFASVQTNRSSWRRHLVELVVLLDSFGAGRHGAHLERLADVNSLKKPFTAADEVGVTKSILEYLAALKTETGIDRGGGWLTTG